MDPRAPKGGIRAVLSGFDVDSETPKPEHLEFLNRSVFPIGLSQPSRIWLQGQASHTGTHRHNLELSHRRALRIADHLIARGIPHSRIQIDWVGDSLAGPIKKENFEARAVSLLAAQLAPAPPSGRTPQVPTATQATNTTFKIRVLGALSAGAGPVQVEQIFVQIWDVLHKKTTFYMYQSAGIGKGFGVSIGTTLSGPWNDFSVTRPIAVDGFGGAARFTTMGGGFWTLNYLNMMALPPGTATSPNPLKLETGFTAGLGASSSVGRLIPGFTGPFSEP